MSNMNPAIKPPPCPAEHTPISGTIVRQTDAAIQIEIINVGNHEFTGFDGEFVFWIPVSQCAYIKRVPHGSADHDILHVANWVLRKKGIIL